MLHDEEDEKPLNFHDMELDDRILKAVAKLGWIEPTLIQEKAIPLLLAGKDVLIRAWTGSGKTAAFAIPVIQKILNSKITAKEQTVKALVLAPSRELCSQIQRNFSELAIKCSQEVQCVDISSQVNVDAQRPLLVFCPDIVVATPSRALEHLKAKNLKLKDSLEILVIDEADLIFSFGFENEIREIVRYLPSVYQAALASATLSEDVLNLKRLVLHNPVILKLNEAQLAPPEQLAHYALTAEEQDKAALLCTMLKLQLVRGKTIIFVNTVDKCYKLKLFLEQFGIRTCVLNSELPANVRCHSVNQFNGGMYDIIIASDEHALETAVPVNNKKKLKRKKDKESGVSRGIDFQFVSNVLNFDFPLDVNSYIHRVGRTARGNNSGTALSFVSMREMPLMKKVEAALQPLDAEESFFKAYEFKMEEVEGFRYRSKDAWRAVTRVAVREARLKEIKQEIMNSQVLKGYFEDNPNDYNTLRHDKALHTVRLQQHLTNVPEYLVPNELKQLTNTSIRKRTAREPVIHLTHTKKKFQRNKANPLMSFEFKGFKNDKQRKDQSKPHKSKKKKDIEFIDE